MKELKDLFYKTKNKIRSLERQITNKRRETFFLKRDDAYENAKEVLKFSIFHQRAETWKSGSQEKNMSDVTEGAKAVVMKYTQVKLSILKIEGQLKRVLIEKKLIWEDIGRVLGKFINEELDLN